MRVSGLELGGLAGSLVAVKLPSLFMLFNTGTCGSVVSTSLGMDTWGLMSTSGVTSQGRLSDYLITTSKEGQGTVGMRIRVVAGYCLGLCAALALFTTVPGDAGALQWMNVFMIGFFIYGPQVRAIEPPLCDSATLIDTSSLFVNKRTTRTHSHSLIHTQKCY
jgi:hypothetical protein